MRVALYPRVSSQEQAEHGVSLAEQKERLEAWAKLEGWEIVDTYSDEGYSGGTGERPELQRLLQDALAGKFDAVLVTKIDRLFRNTRLLLNYIHELEQAGVVFMAQAEGINTSQGGIGKVILNLLGSVAEWERARIGERIRDFRTHLAKKGQWSSGRTPFGLRFDKQKKELVIDPLESEAVRFIFETYTQKQLGIVRVAQICNEKDLITPRPGRRQHTTWTQSAVRHVLTHPAYKGGPNDDWPFKTPAIIKPDLWENCQRQLANNRHFRASDSHSPYQGLLRCGLCNHTLRIGWSHNKFRKWECPGRLGKLHLDGSPRCTLPRFDADALEYELAHQVIKIFSDPELLNNYILSTIKNLQKEHRELERRLKPVQDSLDRVRKAMEKADTMYEVGRLSKSEYKARIEGLRHKQTELEKQTTAADPMLLRQLADNEKAARYYQSLELWIQFKRQERQEKADRVGELQRKIEKSVQEDESEHGRLNKIGEILSTFPRGDSILASSYPTMRKMQELSEGTGFEPSFHWDLFNGIILMPEADIINNPGEVSSQQLRKLGLYAYIFPNKIEIKGAVRKTNTTPACRSGHYLRFL